MKIPIPDEARKAVYDLFPPGYLESIGLHPESIAAAALNAWPGFAHIQRDWDGSSRIILFLPKDDTQSAFSMFPVDEEHNWGDQ